jgi:hypothetical protein
MLLICAEECYKTSRQLINQRWERVRAAAVQTSKNVHPEWLMHPSNMRGSSWTAPAICLARTPVAARTATARCSFVATFKLRILDNRLLNKERTVPSFAAPVLDVTVCCRSTTSHSSAVRNCLILAGRGLSRPDPSRSCVVSGPVASLCTRLVRPKKNPPGGGEDA